MSNTEKLRRAEAKLQDARELAEEAARKVEIAEESVAEAKGKIAEQDAPKFVGRAFRWRDQNSPVARHSSSYFVFASDSGRVKMVVAEFDGLIYRAAIGLREDRADEFVGQIEDGWLVEINRNDFNAEYVRVAALIATEVNFPQK